MNRKVVGILVASVAVSCVASASVTAWIVSARVTEAQVALIVADTIQARLVQSVEVTAEDFKLLNRRTVAGQAVQTPPRARLFVGADGQPVLQLLDEAQRPRAALGFTNGQPSIGILDEGQRQRISASISSAGNGLLSVTDATGREVVSIREQSNGAPSIQLIDSGGGAQIVMGLTEESDPALRRPFFRMIDAQGNVVFQAPTAPAAP